MTDQQQQQNEQTDAQTDESAQPAKGSGYHVSDLPEGATPDPLGDASLTPHERAGAGSSDGQ